MTPHARRLAAANALDAAQREVRLAQQRAELHAADPAPVTHLEFAAWEVQAFADAWGTPLVWVTPSWCRTAQVAPNGAVTVLDGRVHRCAHTIRNGTGACIACGQRDEPGVGA